MISMDEASRVESNRERSKLCRSLAVSLLDLPPFFFSLVSQSWSVGRVSRRTSDWWQANKQVRANGARGVAQTAEQLEPVNCDLAALPAEAMLHRIGEHTNDAASSRTLARGDGIISMF